MKRFVALITLLFSFTACSPAPGTYQGDPIQLTDLDGSWHPVDVNSQVTWPTTGAAKPLTFQNGILTVTDTVNNVCNRVRRFEIVNLGNNFVPRVVHTTCDVSSVCVAAGGMGCTRDFATDSDYEMSRQDFAFLGADLLYTNRQVSNTPIVFKK